MLFSLSSMAAEGERPNVNFNHDQTTFPLRGLHSNTACESCHINGVFKGTPNTCEGCHSRGGASTAKLKPATHIPVVADCSSCHIAQSWLPARFSHNSLTQSCATCHNGTSATGKPTNHLYTRGACDTCHKTSAWVPANFAHDSSMINCSACHDGRSATGKPPPTNHITTTQECSNCHVTSTWSGATFQHNTATVAPGSCISCHLLGSGNQKPTDYGSHSGRAIAMSCDVCHRVTTWTVATYSHTGVSVGCFDCHNGVFLSPSKPAGHTDNTTCESCHRSTTSWATSSFSHNGVRGYYPHSAARTCVSCHGTPSGGSIARNAYYSSCAWCHASQFRAGSHVKTQSPNRILYTVIELEDCTGACHEYTTSTSGVIKVRKIGHHRSTDGGW